MQKLCWICADVICAVFLIRLMYINTDTYVCPVVLTHRIYGVGHTQDYYKRNRHFQCYIETKLLTISQNSYMFLYYILLTLYNEFRTNVSSLGLLSHDRYQYDSRILSKQNWAYPRQLLRQLLWCQGHWRGYDVTKEYLETNFHLFSTLLRKLCVHYANGFDNVESVYFLYSNTVYYEKIIITIFNFSGAASLL
jgi:hypothetical protein